MSTTNYVNTAFNTNYGVKASDGTMGILSQGTKVLIIQRRLKNEEFPHNGPPNDWSFAGGGLEADETPEQCIVREYKEELGIDVIVKPISDEPVWATTDDDAGGKLWRCSFFDVEQTKPEQTPKIMEPEKHADKKWIEWKELWAMIKAENEGPVDESDKRAMRFYPSMKNMVLKYPGRGDSACLRSRV